MRQHLKHRQARFQFLMLNQKLERATVLSIIADTFQWAASHVIVIVFLQSSKDLHPVSWLPHREG